jgi:GNAT superfamily N-acetyltransferase
MTIGASDPTATPPRADRAEIVECAFDHPDASRLLRAFHDEQVRRYGFADPIDMDPCGFAAPNGAFAVVYERGAPVGCGGYRWFDRLASTIEIKKTYMVPASRGRGAGRTLLSWLEHHAAANGARQAILETGVRNAAALHLFTSTGYRPIDRYVDGRDPAINRAFVKSFAESAQLPAGDVLQAIAR